MRPKSAKLMPKLKCTILLKQLYYIYYDMRPKSAPNGVIVMCFHPKYLLFNIFLYLKLIFLINYFWLPNIFAYLTSQKDRQ